MALELTEEQTEAGWELGTLGDYLKFSNGRKSPGDNPDGSKKIWGANGVIGHTDETNALSNTVVVGRVGAYCGSVAFSREKSWVTDNAIKGERKLTGDDARFWYYKLISMNLSGYSHGTSQPLINQGILNSLAVSVPSQNERNRIAEILGSLDDKIEANRSVISLSLKIAQEMYILEKNNEYRSVILLEDLFADLVGGDWGKEKQADNLFPVYAVRGADIPSLQRGENGSLPLRFIKESSLNRRVLRDGDVVVEGSGGSPTQCTGRPVFVTQELLDCYEYPLVATNFCKIIKPVEQAYGLSIYLAILDAWEQGELWQYETGTTGIKNLNFSLFASQKKVVISDIARPYIESVSRFGAENAFLEETRNLLICKLIK